MGTHEPSILPSLSGCVWKHAPELAVVLGHHLPSRGRFSAGARSPARCWKCDLAMALMSRPKCAHVNRLEPGSSRLQPRGHDGSGLTGGACSSDLLHVS